MKTILVVDDDKDINDMLVHLLETNGYQVLRAFSGTEALLVYNNDVSLVLLDLMLPGKSGEEIIRDLKKVNHVPVLVMSAIHEMDKKLDLFKLGADDYVTKPFNNEELLARIRVHLRNNSKTSAILKFKDLEMNVSEYKVTCNHKELVLTKNEFEILHILLENQNQVVTKSVLFERVWGDFISSDENTLNVHISKIRNKLKECNVDEEYIETIWSVGYRMKK